MNEIAKVRDRCITQAERAVQPLEQLDAEKASEPAEPAAEPQESVLALKRWCETMQTIIGKGLEKGKAAADALAREFAAIAQQCGLETADADTITAIRNAAKAADQQKGAAIAEAKAMKKRLKEREELAEGIAAQQREAAVFTMLGSELRANNFIDFVLGETLELLAARASEELMRLSDGRYELATIESEFCVIDHVNADETRSVATLSGGETFLASLALALALSQHIGELRSEGMGARLDAVFIDEGFGSLDPQTLEDVVNALERLREADLTVGVITHVAAMAERINVGLVVERAAGRSQIRVA